MPLPSKSECCPPGGKCKTFEKITDETSCSKEYDDNIAITMCPFVKNYCGPKKEFIFKDHRMAKGGSPDVNITLPNLKENWSCTFTVKAKCGAPAFRFKGINKTLAAEKIEIAILEYDEKNYVPPLGEDSFKFI